MCLHRLRAPDGFTAFLVMLSLLSAYLVLLREAAYGVGVSWDSMNYIAGANKLLDGNFLVAYPAFFPPLFPMLLAAAGLFVLDPRDVAGPFNAVVFGLIVFVAGQWLRNRLRSRLLVVWSCLAVAFSIPLANAASMAWSEAVFVLFTLLALVSMDKFLNTNQRSQLLWAALYTALACTTRYAGVALVMAVVLLLLVQRDMKPFELVKRVSVYLLVAVTPLGLWLLRNILFTGTLTSNRNPSGALFLDTLAQINEVVSRWAFPGSFSNRLEAWVERVFPSLPAGALQVFAETLIGTALLALMTATGYSLLRSCRDAKLRDIWSPFYTFGAFTCVYIGFMLATWLIFHIDPPNNRLLCPVYIPLLFVTVFAMDRLIRCEQERKWLRTVNNLPIIRVIAPRGVNVLTGAIAMVLCLWFFQAVALNAAFIEQSKSGKYSGYASPRWAHSETIRYIQTHYTKGVIYTNKPPAIYFNAIDRNVLHFTLHVPPDIWSRASGLHCFNLPYKWNKLVRRIEAEHTAGNDVYIVWFHDQSSRSSHDYGPRKIGLLPYMEPVVELSDSVIFRVMK